jgi:hypothetical protein
MRVKAMAHHTFRKTLISFVVCALFITGIAEFPGLKAAAHPPVIERAAAFAAPSTPIPSTFVKWIAFGLQESWAILIGKNGYSTFNVPKSLNEKLKELNADDEEIKSVSFAADDGWVIIYGDNGYWLNNIPQDAADKLKELNKKKSVITQVTFGAKDSWVIIFDDNGYSAVGMPKGLTNRLKDANTDGVVIKQVSIDANGEWFILYGKNGYYWTDNLPEGALKKLKEYNTAENEIFCAAFGPDGGWVVISDAEISYGDVAKDVSAKIKELLNGS